MLKLKLTKGDTSITIEKALLHFPLSTNVERMRKKIINFQTINPGKIAYSNPVRYIIAESMKNKTPTNDEQVVSDNITLNEKVESELLVAIQKEINNDKQFVNVNFETIEDIDEFDVIDSKSSTGYILSDVNPNTFKFMVLLGEFCQAFDAIYLVKPAVDDTYTDRFVVITGEKDDTITSIQLNTVSTDVQELLINFLYTVSAQALYIFRTDKEQYKFFVSRLSKILNQIGYC